MLKGSWEGKGECTGLRFPVLVITEGSGSESNRFEPEGRDKLKGKFKNDEEEKEEVEDEEEDEEEEDEEATVEDPVWKKLLLDKREEEREAKEAEIGGKDVEEDEEEDWFSAFCWDCNCDCNWEVIWFVIANCACRYAVGLIRAISARDSCFPSVETPRSFCFRLRQAAQQQTFRQEGHFHWVLSVIWDWFSL